VKLPKHVKRLIQASAPNLLKTNDKKDCPILQAISRIGLA